MVAVGKIAGMLFIGVGVIFFGMKTSQVVELFQSSKDGRGRLSGWRKVHEKRTPICGHTFTWMRTCIGYAHT
jgi:hypothetical protein